MNQTATLDRIACTVADALQRTGRQLVLAESCTAGLVAASLGGVPGISQHFCGSAVVYQEATKTAWLNVPAELLAAHGAVSQEVASAMVEGALMTTPHANLGAAITGHLGPQAPNQLDGLIYVAVQFRGQSTNVVRHQLETVDSDSGDNSDSDNPSSGLRKRRQVAAAQFMLEQILAALP